MDPYLIAVCGQYMTECLFTVMVAFSFALVIWASRARFVTKYVIAGLETGAAVMTRPEFFVFIAGAVLIAVLWGQRHRRALCIVAFVIASMAFPSIWAARNHQVFGRWIFTTTHGGYTHRLAYNEVFYDEVVSGRTDRGARKASRSGRSPSTPSSWGLTKSRVTVPITPRRAILFGRQGAGGQIGAVRDGQFLARRPAQRERAVALALAVFFLALMGLAAVGVYVAWRTHPAASLILFLMLAETAVHM